jgi:hypothetical protein
VIGTNAKHLMHAIGNKIHTKIFIETKGEMEGALSSYDGALELGAERVLGRIVKLLPHFIHSMALKRSIRRQMNLRYRRIHRSLCQYSRKLPLNTHRPGSGQNMPLFFTDMRETEGIATDFEPTVFQMEREQNAKKQLELVPLKNR